MNLLIIEDDRDILSFLKRGLEEEDFNVDTAENGEIGEYKALENIYDVIIIDWMLPDKNGIGVIKSIRKEKSIPILMLTAKGTLNDKIESFKSGADDYLVKPFEFEELLLRIEALYRRSLNSGKNIIKIQDLEIDIESKEIKKEDKIIKLNNKEYELLLFMIKHKNQVLSNDMIKEYLWKDTEYINSNVIAVTMYNLRKKIGKKFISNIRKIGYKLEI